MESFVVVPEKRRGRKRKRIDVNNVLADSDGKKKVVETRSLKFVGRYVRKEFEGLGLFLGKITSYDSGLYRVNYEDGDSEDLDSSEVKVFLIEDTDLTGELFEEKEKLDKSLLSKEIKGKVPKTEKKLEQENICGADPSNSNADANEVVKVSSDGYNNADADSDSSTSDSFEDTQELVASLNMDVPPVSQPELPISSGHIGVPEAYVSHLFSVYGFFRLFSTILFLYPFGLNDFVGSLNCSVANTLLDAVHVALMRVLKSHLERLSTDGSELASKCLRLLDWNLLDTVTWPVLLAHYLMVMGYRNGPDWKSFYTHSLDRDYYSLSAGRKLIILQILCDDVLDSEELRAEMDMREESEVGIDIDSSLVVVPAGGSGRVHPRYSKTSACKNRDAVQSIAEHNEKKNNLKTQVMVSQLDAPVGSSIDEDGNGDECRLCGMDGFLLCCDGCPSSYHTRCLGLSKMHMPSGSWFCPECKINETEPKVSQETALRAGENFGVDPYEQVFVATCDHLLVLTASINSENCLRYYNRHDIQKVLHALCMKPEHAAMYSEICRGIMRHWEFPQDILPSSAESEVGIQYGNAKGIGDSATQSVDILDRSGAEMTETEITGSSVTGSCRNNNVPVNGTSVVARVTRSCVKLDDRADRKADSDRHNGCLYMGSSFKINGYINHYLHGDFAASAAANLAILSSEENQGPDSRPSDNRRKLMSTSILLQVKAFSSAALRFIWPNTEKKLVEVPRERCSWCFSCKAHVSSKRGCLLNAAASNATRGAMKVLSGVRLMKNGDGRLPGIATYVMFMEESLSGLVGGPFLNDTFRKRWRKQVEQASTFDTIKILLLELEENIRSIALSGDWTKLVDGGSTQSSSSQTENAAASTQKRRPGRRGRRSSAVVEIAVDDSQDTLTDLTWWRGGTLSKLMFRRGALPCPMLRKAARQGGSKMIPGIHYVEGHEIPKTSRQLTWRSAVEMSRNTSQLGLQVRYLDFYVRWSDLVRPDQIPTDGKGPETEASAFRNASICDKKILEHEIRYCVDFGSQKHLPSRVMKNIAEIEQNSDDGTERYWFSETRIPLYLIKEYEEKVEIIKHVDVLSKVERRQLKASRKNKLLHLLRKHNNMVTCCSCHQDVMHRESIKCNACQGHFHTQCGSSSTARTNEEVECLIMCKKCCESRAVNQVKSSNKSPTSPLRLKIKLPNVDATKKCGKLADGHRASSSSFKAQKYSSGKKSTNVSASANRSKIKHWGLIWRKPNSEDFGIDFRLKNILHKGNPNTNLTKLPSCRLCSQPYNADLMYIFCEACQSWYHADALELNESEIFRLVGFKCCRCRRIRSPVCPYMDSDKKKVLDEKIERKKSSNTDIFDMDSDISEHHKEEGLTHALKPEADNNLSADDPLLSLSDLDQYTEGNSEVDYGWSNSPSFMCGPRKLPVRRQNKQQNGPDCAFPADPFQVEVSASTAKLPIRRHRKTEENNLDCYSATNPSKIKSFNNPSEIDVDSTMQDALPSPQIQWDVSNENFDDGITLDYGCDDMEFEPQTYFSFNELLASDDGRRAVENESPGDVMKNWEASGSFEIPYDEEEPIISMETDIPLVACKICSKCEPYPSLFCGACGIWVHSHCSPWLEDSSSVDGWKCGSCRDWK